MKQSKRKGWRKERSDKKVRVYPYFTQETFEKLNMLSRSCDTNEHELTVKMVELVLASPEGINLIQNQHGIKKDDPFRVHPLRIDGEVFLRVGKLSG
jgi:hypothetical protein